MALSDYEIERITEIVAGRIGENLDGKALRQIVDRVVDSLQEHQRNPEIPGATCEVSRSDIKPTEKPSPSTKKIPIADIAAELAPTDESKAGLYEQIERTDATRIIVAAFGHDRPGVVAAISNVLADNNCSIEDISQTLLQEFFSMIMVVNISGSQDDFAALREKIQSTESQLGMKVYVMHEDIFRYMHRI
jgi:ACT domain-containing protein